MSLLLTPWVARHTLLGVPEEQHTAGPAMETVRMSLDGELAQTIREIVVGIAVLVARLGIIRSGRRLRG